MTDNLMSALYPLAFLFSNMNYFRGTSSYTRRSCQTVLEAHLLSIARVIAPIVPHLAEDVWQNLPFQYRNEDGSTAKFVFEAKWPPVNETWLNFPKEETDFWEKILEVINSYDMMTN